MKKKLASLFLILVFLAGLGLLLYPTVSDYWNSLHQSRAVADYAEKVADLDNEVYNQLLEAAHAYNASLLKKSNPYRMSEENLAEYNSILNIGGNGIMGYIEIPRIDCSLPVYHSTEESALQIAIGHVDWTSLPVGGESTHSVLSGHRGLPSARLFTDLDKLEVGDLFIIRVLDETMTYEVDQINIVEPHESQPLTIVKGKDYCTLVTCTPYGINSHRLLVRGHRVENQEVTKTIRVTADAMQIEPLLMAPIVAAPMLLFLLVLLVFKTGGKKKEQ